MELVVGMIVRAHGIHGEVVVDVRTDDPEGRFAPGAVVRTDPNGCLTVTSARRHRDRLLVRFAEIADRTAAERWRGRLLLVEVPDDARPENPDEYYDQQLVGLGVVTKAGEAVGEIAEVLHIPAQDVLVVRGGHGEILVPFVAPIVTEVNIAAGRLVLTPPPGLLDPADAEVAE